MGSGQESDYKPRHRRTFALSTTVSVLTICGVILPVLGIVSQDFVVRVISNAMAQEIQEHVSEQVAPINAGLKVLIQTRIAELEDQIGRLSYRREFRPETWTDADEQELITAGRRLRAQNDAWAAIVQAEREWSARQAR